MEASETIATNTIMDITRLKTLSEQDRKAVLESEAIDIEEGVYDRPLTEEEINYYKDELATQCITQKKLLAELATVKEEFKEKLRPVKTQIDHAMNAIKNRSIPQEGRLYKLADYDEKMIYTVDGDGNVISSRRMRPEERQYRIQAVAGS